MAETEADETRIVTPSEGASTADGRPPQREVLPPGTQIGRYVVLARAGSGGMGDVYAAYDPELDRKVALKLLPGEDRTGTAGGDAEARLLREAQAMAQLSHENVVAVHDLGTWRDLVFIAMEFIDGDTLRAWLKARPRTWADVLGVMIPAARGLAAAHAAGLVHRDFKPANVMIRSDGAVRVLDFGLARRMDTAAGRTTSPDENALLDSLDRSDMGASGRRSVDGPLTRTGLVTGTPAYMAPEQFVGAELDARTDQFAFCIALYEAVYGERPFGGSSLKEIAREVHTGRVRPAPAGHRVPPRLRKVILRGLAVDPAARHPSMDALVEALRRAAHPPWRRTLPMMAGVTGIGALALAMGMPQAGDDVCSGAQAELAQVWDDARAQAIAQAFHAVDRPYADTMLERVQGRIEGFTADWIAGRTGACEATRRGEQSAALLDRRMACYDGRLAELRALGDVLASADAAVVEKAVDITGKLGDLQACEAAQLVDDRVTPPPADVAAEVAELRETLATTKLWAAAGKYQDALPMAEGAAEKARALGYDPVLGEALQQLGTLQYALGQADTAEGTITEALLLAEATAHDELELRARISLASVTGLMLSRPDDGRTHLRFAQAVSGRVPIRGDLVGAIATVEGILDYRDGEHEAAAKAFTRSIAEREAVHGADHPDVAGVLVNLGAAQVGLGRNDEALATFERAVELHRRVHGDAHPVTGSALNGLSMAHYKARHLDEALEIGQRALEVWTAALPADHPDLARGHHNMGTVLTAMRRWDEALSHYEAALQAKLSSLGAAHPSVAASRSNVADLLNRMGRHEEALEHAEAALKIGEAALGAEHLDLANMLLTLGEAELGTANPAEASTHLRRALAILEGKPGQDADRAAGRLLLAKASWRLGEHDTARELATQARDDYAAMGEAYLTEREAAEGWLAHPDAGT